MDSTPLIIEVVIVCSPALRAQGFINNSGAPASPWRSGFPAHPVAETSATSANEKKKYIDLFIDFLLKKLMVERPGRSVVGFLTNRRTAGLLFD
jgi:hypothetical protein